MLKTAKVFILGLGLYFTASAQARVVDKETSSLLKSLIDQLPQELKEETSEIIPEDIVVNTVKVQKIDLEISSLLGYTKLGEIRSLEIPPVDLMNAGRELLFSRRGPYAVVGLVDITCVDKVGSDLTCELVRPAAQ